MAAEGCPTSATKGWATLRCDGPLEVLVNTRVSALPYEATLLNAIPTLEGNELEMAVRALSERGMRQAGPALAALMASDTQRGHDMLLWAIGNALNAINDTRTHETVLRLCADARLGSARQMLFSMLPKIRTDQAFQLALAGLNDPTVRAHAIEAIGRFGRPEALARLMELQTQVGLYEHKARATAIRRLERARNRRGAGA